MFGRKNKYVLIRVGNEALCGCRYIMVFGTDRNRSMRKCHSVIVVVFQTDAPNVTITPLKDTYEVGERITMVVDARPVASSYEWIGLSANLRFKSRRLTIIKQMIGTQTFLAKATNSPFGVDHSGNFQFTFFVPTRELVVQHS